MKAINIQVDEDLYNNVKQYAQQHGKTLAQVVREALQNQLQHTQQQNNEIQELKKRIEKLEQLITNTIPTKTTQTPRLQPHSQQAQPQTPQTTTKTPQPQIKRRPTQKNYPQGKYEAYIIQIMNTNPDDTWHWNTVAQEIYKRDSSINLLSVKDRMNRMSKQGQLLKTGRGEYKLITP